MHHFGAVAPLCTILVQRGTLGVHHFGAVEAAGVSRCRPAVSRGHPTGIQADPVGFGNDSDGLHAILHMLPAGGTVVLHVLPREAPCSKNHAG